MKTISIANRKGGVGKTTLAANLSYELSKMNYLVVMIDLDPQCDLSKIYLNNENGKTILEVLKGNCDIENAAVEIADNLYLVPGNKDMGHYKNVKGDAVLKEKLKHEGLGEVDFVIIDHPPNLNEGALEGFKASDEALVVTDPETFSIENLDNLLEDLAVIKNDMNSKLHILGVAINRVDLRRKLTKKKIKELKSILKEEVFKTHISNDTAIPISLDEKVPIRKLHYRSSVVSQINNLTMELLKRMGYINDYGQATAK